MPNSLTSDDHRAARRFAVNVPVELKTESNERVLCSSRDVSSRGIFVLTEQPLPEHSPIEFTMKLNSPDAPDDGVRVRCTGTVIRVESPVDGDVGMAATIDSYRFLPHRKAHA